MAVLRELRAKATPKGKAPLAVPSTTDNSAALPPVGDQGNQGSCVSWALGYYCKTYQEGREYAWDVSNPSNHFSPAFLYNQLQHSDDGSTFEDNLDLLVNQGCATLTEAPYDDSDHLTWPSADAYRHACSFPAASYDYLGTGETPGVFDAVKALAATGELCVVGITIYAVDASTEGLFQRLSQTNFHYHMPAPEDLYRSGFHALTIVGYDESEFGGAGGYRVVNSWGTDWGNNGFAWISEPFLAVHAISFYRMTDRVGYTPASYARFKLSHSNWSYDNVTVTLGVGATASPSWSKRVNKRIPRESLTVDRWVDITDASAYLAPTWTNRWWLKTEDGTELDGGILSIFDIEVSNTLYSAAVTLPFSTSLWDSDARKRRRYAYIPAEPAAGDNYYVNDGGTNGDVYCTAPGDDANDGLTPATPKRTLQAVVSGYTLLAGNRVYIDAGTYSNETGTLIDYLDKGAPGNPIEFIGAPSEGGTVLAGPSDCAAVLDINDSSHLVFRHLTVRGGRSGIACDGTQAGLNGSQDDDIVFQDVHVSGAAGLACNLLQVQKAVFRNCTIQTFGDAGIHLKGCSAWIERSTVCAEGTANCISATTGIPAFIDNMYVGFANSILRTENGRCFHNGGYANVTNCAFNDLYVAGSGSIGLTPNDSNISADPLFANPAAGDLHLMSEAGRWDPSDDDGTGSWVTDSRSSPCIDAGDFFAAYGSEPIPNGRRLNMGAFAGTSTASKSAAIRHLVLDTPVAGATYYRVCSIRWHGRGFGWEAGDTLRVEHSADGGLTYGVVPDADELPFRSGAFIWDLEEIAPGGSNLVRLVCNQDSNALVVMQGTFTIAPTTRYYVNDTSVSNDVYCTAAGHAANDGLAPESPMARIQAVIDRYDLGAGDTIHVDTGEYLLASNIVISAVDSGSADGLVTVIGSTHSRGSVIDRGSTNAGCYAVHLDGCSYVALERLRIRGADRGVHGDAASSCAIRHCRVSSCSYGIHANGGPDYLVENNVVFSNSVGVEADWAYPVNVSLSLLNNTFEANDAAAFRHGAAVYGPGKKFTLRNNIFSQHSGYGIDVRTYIDTFRECDHNTFHLTGSAQAAFWLSHEATPTLSLWQAISGSDSHSQEADPLFANATAGDYHLRSVGGRWDPSLNSGVGAWVSDAESSPCIDGGDLADSEAFEPSPHGGRRNSGAYGGTAQASRSRSHLVLAAPSGGERWSGSQTIRWSFDPTGLLLDDTLRIEYSSDGGTTWQICPNGAEVDHDRKQWTWDTTQAPDSVRCRVRVTCNRDGGITDAGNADFTIANHGIDYFVNDASVSNDVYCTAAGHAANDGLTPASPKTRIQAVIDRYDLASGDTIYVDTGEYLPASNIVISAVDSGSEDEPVTVIGSTHSRGSVIDRGGTDAGCYAFHLDGCSHVALERLRIHGADRGVYAEKATSCRVRHCRVSACAYGIHANGGRDYLVENNVVFSNDVGVEADRLSPTTVSLSLINNTLAANSTAAFRHQTHYSGGGNHFTLRNNLFSQQGGCGIDAGTGALAACDYNTFHLTGGAQAAYGYASLPLWQAVSGLDVHSVAADPLFADATAGDYHLRSSGGRWDPALNNGTGAWVRDLAESPCIDGGNPEDEVALEPSPHGGRRNIGAYGGTAQASRSRGYLVLAAPNGGERWSGSRTIRWSFDDTGLELDDTLRIEYSSDGGTTWQTCPNGAAVDHDRGKWTWDTTQMPDGVRYRVRVTCNRDGGIADASDADFIIANRGIDYFVNDTSVSNDVYCTAAGHAANDGLAPGSPMARIQAVIDRYDLGAEDTIHVDTGEYLLASNIVISAVDSGLADGLVTVIGSTHSRGSVIDRGSTNAGCYAVHLDGCSYVALERLRIRGADRGVHGDAASSCAVRHCRVSSCAYGIHANGGPDYLVENNVVFSNSVGVAADWVYPVNVSLSLLNNTFEANGAAAFRHGASVYGPGKKFTLRNNIFSQHSGYGIDVRTSFDTFRECDHNTFHLTGSAQAAFWLSHEATPTLSLWQRCSALDGHSVAADPLFADAAAGDFHLRSTGGRWDPALNNGAGAWVQDSGESPCVDAGDPSDDHGDEPAPNGGRINMGAYGGTTQASMSNVGRSLDLRAPVGGEQWRGAQFVEWALNGQNWQPGDTVSLWYSGDSGTNWTALPGAAVPAGRGRWEWSLYAMPSGTHYRVKIAMDSSPSVSAASAYDFSISPSETYYVNDDSTAGDVYCTSVGSDTNDGMTASTPKATLQAVIDAYELGPGDAIYVDAGTYDLAENVAIGISEGNMSISDHGAPGNPVVVRGVPGRSILRRNSPGTADTYCLFVNGDNISIDSLVLETASIGICVSAFRDNVSVTGCRLRGHGLSAYKLGNRTTGCVVSGNVFEHFGTGAAIVLDADLGSAPSIPCTVSNNTIFCNKGIRIETDGGPNIVGNIILADGADGFCFNTYYYYGHVSDYNNLYARNSALIVEQVTGRPHATGEDCSVLSEWTTLSGQDRHSISLDPLFADEAAGDLHVRSAEGRWDPIAGGAGAWTNDAVTSPCIDAGAPGAAYDLEPEPNGGRINLGAYAGTIEASKSPDTDRWLVFESAGRSPPLHSWEPIHWSARGTNWDAAEAVALSYSPDGGTTWIAIAAATHVPIAASPFWWDTTTVSNGAGYRLRVASVSPVYLSSTSEGSYTIDNARFAPALAWTGGAGYETDGVDPDVGTSSTTFTFRVIYTDGDNHPPQQDYPRVHILKGGAPLTGSPFAMTAMDAGDTNYIDGRLYAFERAGLAPGDDYSHRFDAVDSHAAPADGPPTDAQPGPRVLRTFTLAVESTFDVVSPPVGVHAYPAAGVSCVVTSAVLYEGSLATQYVCTGWAGSGSLTNGSGTNAAFVLTGDAVIRWLWATNYWLAVTTEGSGTTDRASGWYADASNVTFTALPVAHSHFSGWAGDTNGCAIDGARITVPVDSPRQITAEFAVDMHTVAVQSAHGHTVLERTTPTRLDIGFPGYDRSEVLNDFPVLISLGTNISGFGYDQFKSPAGEDLRFLDAAGALELAYEIENWDTGGVSHVWVQIPSLSSDTRILATWGVRSLAAPAYTTNGAAWSNGYAAVWHLNEDAGEHVDSTIRRNDVGPSGTMNQGASGMVAGGDEFNGASGVCRGVPFPGELTNTFTMALWAKPRAGHQIEPEMTGLMYGAVGQRYALYPCHGAVDYGSSSHAGAGVSLGINGVSVYEQSTSHFPPLLVWAGDVTNWSHVAVVFTNGQPTLYVNGALARTGLASRKVVHPSYAIGADSHGYYDGLLDDVRISDGVRSSNWLWACWMTVASNRPFTAYGNVTGMDGPSYPYGTELRSAVIDSPVSLGTTQVVCTGWIASGSTTNGSGTNVTFVLTEDTDIEWLWATNYWLSATPGPNGHVLAGSRWERAGTIANVEAVPSNYYHFVEWTGTVTSADNPLDVFMTQPHTIVAVFGENLATNGTPEWWLAAHGLTNREWNIEAMMDIDGDGMVAWEEFVADTDPTNRLSCLAIVNIKPVAGGFEVTWRGGEAGKQYLESRLGLLSTSRQWSAVFTNVPPTPVTTSTMHATTNRVLFYRIKAERP